MRIAVDAMGGDFAPREIVRGAINYAAANADEVILVGDVPRIETEIAEYGRGRPASVSFADAPEVIGMGESPASAIRTKRRSSIRVSTDLVRDGLADAVVSAGSTGATMAAAVFRLGRIEGIERPALGAHLVTATGPIMLLDVGANVDSDATNLVHFAVMGSIYAEHVLKVSRPRIGLLNIGEEDEKGDALSREANALMRGLDLNFVGNVEGNDLISHVADVVVCDGFVGNVVIKFFEGLTSYIFRSMRTDLQQGPVAPLALLALKPGFDRLRHRFDYERYGGAPLLGVRGREHRDPRPRQGADDGARHPCRLRGFRGAHPGPDRRMEPPASGPVAADAMPTIVAGGHDARWRRPARGRGLSQVVAPRRRAPPGPACRRGGWRCWRCSRRSSGRPAPSTRSTGWQRRREPARPVVEHARQIVAGVLDRARGAGRGDRPAGARHPGQRARESRADASCGARFMRCYTPPRPRAGRRSTMPFPSPGPTPETQPAAS